MGVLPLNTKLDQATFRIFEALAQRGPSTIEDLAKITGLDQTRVAATARTESERRYLRVDQVPREKLVVTGEALSLVRQGLPERRAAARVAAAGRVIDIAALVSWASEAGVAVNEVFRWGKARGWLERENSGTRVALTEAGVAALETEDDDERAIKLAQDADLYLDQLAEEGIDPERVKKLLANRPQLARIKRRTHRTVHLTEDGQAALRAGFEVRKEQTALSPDDIRTGAWREINLRAYDVTLPAVDEYPAKIHPLRKILEETRRTFLEMGFKEVSSPMVESAFWNFDALYQPQDHPARDMQDTFYMASPERAPLPDAEVVERVRRTHEDGWETGSEGWGYRWNPETAGQLVLRTHTTAATIRALAAHPEPPLKVFCVGWTYRNENIDFKHLPVFHQVDGVVIDEDANLATLFGTLKEFYRKMGFDRVKFKPAFYPYTEPSCDVVVYMPDREQWIEMGGSGIFRPEVTRPFGCRHRVLAWGLGMERLAMLRYGFSDLRELYQSSLDRLQEVGLCR